MTVLHLDGTTRREFVTGLSFAGITAHAVAAHQNRIIPLVPSVEVDNYKKAQALSLARFRKGTPR